MKVEKTLDRIYTFSEKEPIERQTLIDIIESLAEENQPEPCSIAERIREAQDKFCKKYQDLEFSEVSRPEYLKFKGVFELLAEAFEDKEECLDCYGRGMDVMGNGICKKCKGTGLIPKLKPEPEKEPKTIADYVCPCQWCGDEKPLTEIEKVEGMFMCKQCLAKKRHREPEPKPQEIEVGEKIESLLWELVNSVRAGHTIYSKDIEKLKDRILLFIRKRSNDG